MGNENASKRDGKEESRGVRRGDGYMMPLQGFQGDRGEGNIVRREKNLAKIKMRLNSRPEESMRARILALCILGSD